MPKPFRIEAFPRPATAGNKPAPTLRSQCEAARASRLRERPKIDRQRD
jgi:hypothetical protein